MHAACSYIHVNIYTSYTYVQVTNSSMLCSIATSPPINFGCWIASQILKLRKPGHGQELPAATAGESPDPAEREGGRGCLRGYRCSWDSHQWKHCAFIPGLWKGWDWAGRGGWISRFLGWFFGVIFVEITMGASFRHFGFDDSLRTLDSSQISAAMGFLLCQGNPEGLD